LEEEYDFKDRGQHLVVTFAHRDLVERPYQDVQEVDEAKENLKDMMEAHQNLVEDYLAEPKSQLVEDVLDAFGKAWAVREELWYEL
jgi:hypothetical protein